METTWAAYLKPTLKKIWKRLEESGGSPMKLMNDFWGIFYVLKVSVMMFAFIFGCWLLKVFANDAWRRFRALKTLSNGAFRSKIFQDSYLKSSLAVFYRHFPRKAHFSWINDNALCVNPTAISAFFSLQTLSDDRLKHTKKVKAHGKK